MINKIIRLKKLLKNFGFKYAFAVLRLQIKNERKREVQYKTLLVKTLKRENEELIEECCKKKHESSEMPRILWTFWWQGYDVMPDTLKKNYENLKRYTDEGELEIRLITKENINEYVTVPAVIMNRLERGEISYTHFADYYRMALLNKHGGLWFDISLLVVKEFDMSLFEYPFYSNKLDNMDHRPEGIGQVLSECKWTSFLFGGGKGNVLFDFVERALCAYWEKYDYVIDYFLINVLICVAYENIQSVREQIDNVPYNNKNIYKLAALLDKPYDEKVFEKIKDETFLFKVTQKKSHEIRVGETLTTYGALYAENML